MARPNRRLMDRYANVEARAATLGAPPVSGVPGGAPSTALALTPRGPAPGSVHLQVVELLNELLDMVTKDDGPTGLLLRALRRAQPHLLEDFSTVDEGQLVAFLHGIGHRMLAVAPATPALEVVSSGSVEDLASEV